MMLIMRTGDYWCPGAPKTISTDGFSHYVIAAYTIQSGEEGEAGITASRIEERSGINTTLRIYVNDQLIQTTDVMGGGAQCFDVSLGRLKAGDTVYVAFGENRAEGRTHRKKGSKADVDFKIEVADETPKVISVG